MYRCVNIDWLEVFCLEEVSCNHDAQFFRDHGFVVKSREYGTPQYAEMFTIESKGYDFIEIRRNPYSKKTQGGLFLDNACHIRLSNRTCYEESPVNILRTFLIQFGYTLRGITRIDICSDFKTFDNGLDPQNLIKRYMAGKLAKVNQSKVSAHGKDSFETRVWNSLSWGSDKSMVSTKLYNKTLEMSQVSEKPYIRQAWYLAGLITDMDDRDTTIWRLEFSIRSEAKQWIEVTDESTDKPHRSPMNNSLHCYDNRDKLFTIHFSLYTHYFHFKVVEIDESGKKKRKDRCKDEVLFKLSAGMQVYKPQRLTDRKSPTRTDRMLLKKCKAIANDETKEMWQRRAAKNMCIILANDIAAIGYNNMLENLEELRVTREQERYLSLEIDRELAKENL